MERRMLVLVSALIVLLASAVLWNAFVRPSGRVSVAATPLAAPTESALNRTAAAIDSPPDTPRAAAQPAPASGEVRVQWRIQFEGERAGQPDLRWDDDGHLMGGVVTLAPFDAKGQPFAVDEVRVLALHEIGHLLGLHHSPDPGDIMYAQPKVRDLSPRDISTALLLYDLAPGPLRVGG